MASPSSEKALNLPSTPCAASPASSSDSRESTPSASGLLTPTSTTDSSSEKKPVKKRKSWGQQLPTPTTNLPPRKRAKTAEEKEQRRVERVLRNRAAAQKSRELKKAEYDLVLQDKNRLSDENTSLKVRLEQLEQELRLIRETWMPRTSAQQPTPTEEKTLDFLFPTSLDTLPLNTSPSSTEYTLDPATLAANAGTPETQASDTLLTHQPAVLVCDLPCQQRVMAKSSSLMCRVTWISVASSETLWSTLNVPKFSQSSNLSKASPVSRNSATVLEFRQPLFARLVSARLYGATNLSLRQVCAKKFLVSVRRRARISGKVSRRKRSGYRRDSAIF